MRLLLLALFATALPAQQLVIEAEYSRDPVRSYERIGDKHVFRCDGHRWMLPDIKWDMREGAPKTVLQLNEEGTFGCSFTIAGGYTCYLFTPVEDFLETLKTGQQCLKGTITGLVATITPGTATIGAPPQ